MEAFINSYISRYGRPLTKSRKNVVVSAVRHYLPTLEFSSCLVKQVKL